MTTARAIALVSVAALPLAVLTARSFVAGPAPASGGSDLPTYTGGAEELAAARDLVVGLSNVPTDPVGWAIPARAPAADGPIEYRVAAVLDAARKAAKADRTAIADVVAARLQVDGLLAEPTRATIQELAGGTRILAVLKTHLAALERHRKWLDDRVEIEGRVAEMGRQLAGDPNGDNEAACLQLVDRTIRDFSNPGANEADEPPDALTAEERRSIEERKVRALFRREFHEALTTGDPADRLDRLEAFLKRHATAPDARDAEYLETAAEAFGPALLDACKADAEKALQAEGPRPLVAALAKWLQAPPAGPDARKAQALELVRRWLAKALPEAPAPPHACGRLQEATIETGGAAGRLLGVFQQIPGDKQWRYWLHPEQQAEQDPAGARKWPRGFNLVTVKAPPGPMRPPPFVAWTREFEPERDDYLRQPLDPERVKAFAAACDRLAREAAAHRAIAPTPVGNFGPHPNQDAYEKLGGELRESCEAAARTACEFDAAAREAGLPALLQP